MNAERSNRWLFQKTVTQRKKLPVTTPKVTCDLQALFFVATKAKQDAILVVSQTLSTAAAFDASAIRAELQDYLDKNGSYQGKPPWEAVPHSIQILIGIEANRRRENLELLLSKRQ